jgi:hypothetical protein
MLSNLRPSPRSMQAIVNCMGANITEATTNELPLARTAPSLALTQTSPPLLLPSPPPPPPVAAVATSGRISWVEAAGRVCGTTRSRPQDGSWRRAKPSVLATGRASHGAGGVEASASLSGYQAFGCLPPRAICTTNHLHHEPPAPRTTCTANHLHREPSAPRPQALGGRAAPRSSCETGSLDRRDWFVVSVAAGVRTLFWQPDRPPGKVAGGQALPPAPRSCPHVALVSSSWHRSCGQLKQGRRVLR